MWAYESVFYQIDFVKLRLKMMEYEKEKAYPQMECSADTLFD